MFEYENYENNFKYGSVVTLSGININNTEVNFLKREIRKLNDKYGDEHHLDFRITSVSGDECISCDLYVRNAVTHYEIHTNAPNIYQLVHRISYELKLIEKMERGFGHKISRSVA